MENRAILLLMWHIFTKSIDWNGDWPFFDGDCWATSFGGMYALFIDFIAFNIVL